MVIYMRSRPCKLSGTSFIPYHFKGSAPVWIPISLPEGGVPSTLLLIHPKMTICILTNVFSCISGRAVGPETCNGSGYSLPCYSAPVNAFSPASTTV